MSREIRFRGKAVASGLWVYGSLIVFSSEVMSIATFDDLRDIKSIRYHPVAPDTVGQFTGLKGKDKEELWEGDIVRYWWDHEEPEGDEDCAAHPGTVGVVGWHDGYPAFDINPWIDCESNGLQYMLIEGTLYVIGNIHDEPELVGDK